MKTYEIVLRPELKVKAYCKRGVCCVEVRIPTPHGELCLKGSYPLARAAKAVHAWLQRGTSPRVESGSIFKRLRKLTRQVAQATALAPILRSVQQIQKNPILARAVGLTTAVIPGLGAAKIAVNAASNLVQKAARGDLKSLASLNTLKSLAQMGNPQAFEAFRLARVAHAAIKRRAPVNLLRGLAGPALQAARATIPGAPLVISGEAHAAAAPLLQALQPETAYYGC